MRKIGLSLSGGGARGAYQAGAILALEEAGILSKIDVYAGTSIGAANAAVLATNSAKTLKKAWDNIPENPLKANRPFYSTLLQEKLTAFDVGLYSMDTFSSMLLTYLEDTQFNKKVFVTISDGGDENKGIFGLLKASYEHYILDKRKVIYVPLHLLPEKEMLEAIVASCSIPLIFPPITLGHHHFYDGGLFDNTPIQPLIASGCEDIIVMQLTKNPFFHPRDYPQVKIHEIKHRGSLGGLLDFSTQHVKEIFKIGYMDGQIFAASFHR